MERVTQIIGDVEVTLVPRDIRNGIRSRDYEKATRVYGAMNLVPELEAELEKWTSPGVTFEMKRDQPEEAKRIMRGFNAAKRTAVGAATVLLNNLLEKLETSARVKNFSIHAGCSCPCSPGFILTERVYTAKYLPVDIHLSKVK